MSGNCLLRGQICEGISSVTTGLLTVLSKHISVSTSHTVLLKGKTVSKGHEQDTLSLDLIGKSLDLQIGWIPSSSETTGEILIGPLGKHGLISLGFFFGKPDRFGGYESGGVAVHFGIGFGLPLFDLSGTFPEK